MRTRLGALLAALLLIPLVAVASDVQPSAADSADFALSPDAGINGVAITATMLQPCPIQPAGVDQFIEFSTPSGLVSVGQTHPDGSWDPLKLHTYDILEGDLPVGTMQFSGVCETRPNNVDTVTKTLAPVSFDITGPGTPLSLSKSSAHPGDTVTIAGTKPCPAGTTGVSYQLLNLDSLSDVGIGTNSTGGASAPSKPVVLDPTLYSVGPYHVGLTCLDANGDELFNFQAADLTITPAPVTPTPAPRTYAALGDSYSSGEGNPPFVTGVGACDRSKAHAWPRLLARDAKLTLTKFVACSGAHASALSSRFKGQAPQIQALSTAPRPGYVTATFGGNDIGFADVLRNCFFHNCVKDGRLQTARGDLPQLRRILASTYRKMRAAVPGAHVIAVGYPNIFNTNPSNARRHCAWLTKPEDKQLVGLAARLDNTMRAAAGDAGVAYVSTRPVLYGHGLCTGKAWVESLALKRSNSSGRGHPTLAGQQAIARAVLRYLQAHHL